MIKRHFTEEELRRASEDPQALRDLIEASGGYALQKMKKAGLAPPLSALMESPQAESVMFILDNHELTREQQKKLAPFFAQELASARLGGGALSEAEIDEALRSGGSISPKAALTPRQMSQFAEQIKLRYDQDEMSTERLMRASITRLSPEEAQKLGPEILVDHLDIWAQISGAFESESARLMYKSLALKAAEGTRFPPRWSDFSRWAFKAEDKAFLLEILSSRDNYRDLNYEEIEKNPSAAALLGPWEFVQRVSPWSVKHLSMEQTLEKKSEIQELWLQRLLKESYPRLAGLASRVAASLEQFEEILDADLMTKIHDAGVRLDIERLGDADEERKREHLLWGAVAKAALAAPERADELLSARDLGLAISCLTEGNSLSSPRPQDAPLALALARDLIPARLKSSSKELVETLGSRLDSFKRAGVFEGLAEALLKEPTPNGLFLALGVWKAEGSSRARRFGGVSSASRVLARALMRRVDAESANAMAAYFGAPFKAGVNARPSSSFEGDFLKADYARLGELDRGVLSLLSKVEPRFCQKALDSGAEPPEELLSLVLRSGALPGRLEALREWAQRFPEAFEKAPGFMAELSRHPDGPSVWPMDSAEREAQALAQAEAKIRERSCAKEARALIAAQIERERGGPPNEDDPYFEDDEDEGPANDEPSDRLKGLLASQEELSDKESDLKTEIQELLSSLSFEAMSNALDSALREDDYEFFAGLSLGAVRELKDGDRFSARARGLEASRFAELLESDASFARLITGSVNYNGEDDLRLDFGSKEKNQRVCEALFAHFPKDPIQAFAVFEPAAARAFSNELAARRFPQRALFDYRLAPERAPGGFDSRRALTERVYTDEEVISMWDAVEAKGGFFQEMDRNARAGEFFAANYKGDRERFRGFLKKASSRPRLYCLMCSGELLRHFGEADARAVADAGGAKISQDEAKTLIVEREFDFGVVMAGFADIAEEMSRRRGEERFNATLARSALDAVVWATYWDERGATGDIYKSHLSEEKSVALMRLICEKAPAIAYSTHALGTLGFAAEAFERRAGEFLGERALDDFLLPDVSNSPGGLNFSHQREEFATRYLKGLARWLIDEARHEDVEYLNWAIQHAEFKESELSYNHNSMAKGRWQSDAPLDLLRQSEDEGLKKLLSVAFERLEIKEILGETAAVRRRAMRM